MDTLLISDPATELARAASEAWRAYAAGVKAKDYRTPLVRAYPFTVTLAGAGPGGRAALEQLLERARGLDDHGDRLRFAMYPAKVRFQLRRALFRATRDLALLQPGPDLEWLDSLFDSLGEFCNGRWQLLEDVSDAQRLEVLAAWAALDWDRTLFSYSDGSPLGFDEASRIQALPPIEEMTWPALASALEQTSYPRLARGQRQQQTVTRSLAHAPSSAEIGTLLERMLARVMRPCEEVTLALAPIAAAAVR